MNNQTKTRGWPPERRRAQAERLRQTRPWTKSTGPRTPEGKARSAKNALKHCRYSAGYRNLMRALAAQRKWLRQFDARVKEQKYSTRRTGDAENIRPGIFVNGRPSFLRASALKNTICFNAPANRYKLEDMSDSGFSGLPPGARAGDKAFPPGLLEFKARIVELRGELKAAKVRQRLEGEIIRAAPDGRTTIKTGKGEITVELRGRERLPPGTKVEIDLPPGNPPGTPPKQATVRPAPEQTRQPPPPAALPPRARGGGSEAEGGEKSAAPAPPRIDARTAEDLTRYLESRPPEEPVSMPLRPGELVRLLPLTPAQARTLIQPDSEIIRALLTALPAQPQISASAEAFANISPALTLPKTEHVLLSENLPHPLPILTQATAAPLPQERLEALPLAARGPVQQLLQYILQANRPGEKAAPFDISAPPLKILPAGTSFFSETETALTLPAANRLPALVHSGQGPATSFLTLAKETATAALQAARAPHGFFDVRFEAASQPAVRLTEAANGFKTARFLHTIAKSLAALPQGPAGSMTGEVIGMTARRLPVISFFPPDAADNETPAKFVMQFPASNLPPGTQVRIMPLAGKAPAPQGMPLAAQTAALPPFTPLDFFSTFSWPAFEDLTRTLQQTAPQAAQMLANIAASPAAPARLPMAALFFLAVVRTGDISGWLGDKTADALRRIGKDDIVGRLDRDLGGLQRTSAQPPGSWRATALPMMWDGQAHKMMLYYRHDEREDAQGGQDRRRGTRFIFALNLNRLGDVQIDGLHRAPQGAKARLDLILRTGGPLSPPMQQHMRRLYIRALEQTDMAGELSFQMNVLPLPLMEGRV